MCYTDVTYDVVLA